MSYHEECVNENIRPDNTQERSGVFFFFNHAVINVEYQRLANHAASCYLDSGASV